MARGDVHFFAAFELASKTGTSFNLTSDTIKMGIVTNTTIPGVGTAYPTWGAAGTTNFAANEVATGTSYTAGGVTLTGVTYTQSAGVNTLAAANVTVAQDAAGFTNGYYGILYDSTNANKYCIAFVDLGGPVSIQGGALQINWNASGVGTETAA